MVLVCTPLPIRTCTGNISMRFLRITSGLIVDTTTTLKQGRSAKPSVLGHVRHIKPRPQVDLSPAEIARMMTNCAPLATRRVVQEGQNQGWHNKTNRDNSKQALSFCALLICESFGEATYPPTRQMPAHLHVSRGTLCTPRPHPYACDHSAGGRSFLMRYARASYGNLQRTVVEPRRSPKETNVRVRQVHV